MAGLAWISSLRFDPVVGGFEGEIAFDATKPDGTPRKLLSVDRLEELGWRYTIDLRAGLGDPYRWFLEHQDELRR